MREKMLGHLSTYKVMELHDKHLNEGQVFDLKQDPGGIVDIEFLAQYLVLRWSQELPGICQWTDNMRILDSARELGLLSTTDVASLQGAYLQYRSQTHVLALENRPNKVSAGLFIKERRQVREIWHQTLN